MQSLLQTSDHHACAAACTTTPACPSSSPTTRHLLRALPDKAKAWRDLCLALEVMGGRTTLSAQAHRQPRSALAGRAASAAAPAARIGQPAEWAGQQHQTFRLPASEPAGPPPGQKLAVTAWWAAMPLSVHAPGWCPAGARPAGEHIARVGRGRAGAAAAGPTTAGTHTALPPASLLTLAVTL